MGLGFLAPVKGGSNPSGYSLTLTWPKHTIKHVMWYNRPGPSYVGCTSYCYCEIVYFFEEIYLIVIYDAAQSGSVNIKQ